ncbi:hypothetical protein CZ794_12825 [Psychrobacter sp. JB385]|nr:hypothetical protein CZ794_12825 [Psychrobacter sp. JB385]
MLCGFIVSGFCLFIDDLVNSGKTVGTQSFDFYESHKLKNRMNCHTVFIVWYF